MFTTLVHSHHSLIGLLMLHLKSAHNRLFRCSRGGWTAASRSPTTLDSHTSTSFTSTSGDDAGGPLTAPECNPECRQIQVQTDCHASDDEEHLCSSGSLQRCWKIRDSSLSSSNPFREAPIWGYPALGCVKHVSRLQSPALT